MNNKNALRATKKDVLYALQFGGERLVKTHSGFGGREPCQYHLSRTGHRVDSRIATAILCDPHCQPLFDGLLPGESQQFEWRNDAA